MSQRNLIDLCCNLSVIDLMQFCAHRVMSKVFTNYIQYGLKIKRAGGQYVAINFSERLTENTCMA